MADVVAMLILLGDSSLDIAVVNWDLAIVRDITP